MRNITVNLGKRSYSIKIGHGILTKAGVYVSSLNLGKSAVIISNYKTKRWVERYENSLERAFRKKGVKDILTIRVPHSESSKSIECYSHVIDRIAKWDKGKKPFIAALGGGVTGDLAGFVASTYRRGVPLVQIPTTLVAQVDSSIGGKVAIDLPVAKNLAGAFYQPSIVICDLSLLRTLGAPEIKCGLSEIIKYSIINSREFFDYLSRNMASLKKLQRKNMEYVIRRCCSIKAKIVSADENDTKGIRAILNYGHTIGHAIEAAFGYRKGYNHGEAIAIGMVAAAGISNKIGMFSTKELGEVKNIIIKAGLPIRVSKNKSSKIFEALCHDKKFMQGINRFILPTKIGKVKIVKNISKKLIVEAIKEISAR